MLHPCEKFHTLLLTVGFLIDIQRPEFPQQTKDDEMDDSEDGNNSSGNIPDDESLASDGQTEQSIVV